MSLSRKLKKLAVQITLPETLAPDRLVGQVLAQDEALLRDPIYRKREAEIKARMNREMVPFQVTMVVICAAINGYLAWLLYGIAPPAVFVIAFVATISVMWRLTRA